MIYLDSSLIVTALTQEATTAETQAWLRGRKADALWVSWWTDTEVASALAQKQRAGALDDRERAEIQAQWRALMVSWSVAPIERRHFRDAADLTVRKLRAADALHLAVIRSAGAALATRDRELARAAALLGLSVHELA